MFWFVGYLWLIGFLFVFYSGGNLPEQLLSGLVNSSLSLFTFYQFILLLANQVFSCHSMSSFSSDYQFFLVLVPVFWFS